MRQILCKAHIIGGTDVMKKWLSAVLVLAFGLFGAGNFATSAQADTINWNIQSFSQNQVNVKFYSMNRNHQWPSSSSHYPLKTSNATKIAISCIKGERVCYGAVVAGGTTNWGRGPTGKAGCATCCYVCSGNVNTKLIQLNAR
jgi:hypothetical protein